MGSSHLKSAERGKNILAAGAQTAAQRGDLSEQLLGRTRLDWFVCAHGKFFSTWQLKHGWGMGLEHDPILTSRGGEQCLDDVLVTFA